MKLNLTLLLKAIKKLTIKGKTEKLETLEGFIRDNQHQIRWELSDGKHI